MAVVGATGMGWTANVSGSWTCLPLFISSEMAATNSWYPQGSEFRAVQGKASEMLLAWPQRAPHHLITRVTVELSSATPMAELDIEASLLDLAVGFWANTRPWHSALPPEAPALLPLSRHH